MAVTGISASAAKNIKAAIETYRRKVNDANPKCDASIGDSVIQKAIRGANTVAQIKTNINIATDMTNNSVVNYLEGIEKQLDEVVNAYKTSDTAATAVTNVIKKS